MKFFRYILFILLVTSVSGVSLAQSDGELDRFAASAMDKKNVVSLIPNPAIDYIQVKVENSTLEEPRVKLYNVLGNEVEVTLREEEKGVYNIDISQLPAGYYFLAIRDEKAYFRETYKFVKR